MTIRGWLVCSIFISVAWSQGQTPFVACEKLIVEKPAEWHGYDCLFKMAGQAETKDEAVGRLRSHANDAEKGGWASFYLGRVLFDVEPEQAIVWFSRARDRFGDMDAGFGQAYARLNLYRLLSMSGRIDEAIAELEAAAATAKELGDWGLLAQARLSQVSLHIERANDLEQAYRLLQQLQEETFPNGPYTLKRDCLLYLSDVCYRLSRLDEAQFYLDRLAKLAEKAEDPAGQALAYHNLLLHYTVRDLPLVDAKTRGIELANKSLELARKATRKDLEADAGRVLGQLLAGEMGQEHLRSALAVARQTQDLRLVAECLNALAKQIADKDPQQALAYADEALELILQTESPWNTVAGWYQRMRILWQVLPRDEALKASQQALSLMDHYRGTQDEEGSRSGLFAVWTEAYYWLSGRLLDHADLERADIGSAFIIGESMRARVLWDHLSRSVDKSSAAPSDPRWQALAEARQQVSAANRQLLNPEVTGSERAQTQILLTNLEAREKELETQLLKEHDFLEVAPAFGEDGLARIESQLEEDQAMIAMQLGRDQNIYGEAAGGAWVYVITRMGTQVLRLPDRLVMKPLIEAYLGLADDAASTELEESLSREISEHWLDPIVAALPEGVRRLVLIPDGALHELPYARMPIKTQDRPLGVVYSLTRVPSANFWLDLQQREKAPLPDRGLILADPDLPHGQADQSRGRSWVWSGLDNLGPLPYARKEGRRIFKLLRKQGRLLIGAEASEHELKQVPLQNFGLVHFAAHAVVDTRHPRRSAIMLAPGNQQEDGLLQAPEIDVLDFSDRIVVLAACQSAGGRLLDGEGAMSLSRTFLKAGASAVIASLRPLDDEEAEAFFADFYGKLSQGNSLETALQRTRETRYRRQPNGRAWADVILLGDGTQTPLPWSAAPALSRTWWLLLGGLGILGAILFWRRH